MNALKAGDALERELIGRITDVYRNALKTALKRQKAFLDKIEAVDSGKIRPPQKYIDTDTVDKWRQGFVREALRQQQVVDGIMTVLNRAGDQAALMIQSGMVDIYRFNRKETIDLLKGRASVSPTFAMYDKKQIAVLLQENQSPFSKIAYRHLGKNTVIRRRLQNEMMQAIVLGEGRDKIQKRIAKITGQSVYQATRVAQTERTRIQSQARFWAMEEAEGYGVHTVKRWSTYMDGRQRDTHGMMNGQTVDSFSKFKSPSGAELMFPGDPEAPAEEVINCRCVMVPDVLAPGERLRGRLNGG